jgi:hypothetical protein
MLSFWPFVGLPVKFSILLVSITGSFESRGSDLCTMEEAVARTKRKEVKRVSFILGGSGKVELVLLEMSLVNLRELGCSAEGLLWNEIHLMEARGLFIHDPVGLTPTRKLLIYWIACHHCIAAYSFIRTTFVLASPLFCQALPTLCRLDGLWSLAPNSTLNSLISPSERLRRSLPNAD